MSKKIISLLSAAAVLSSLAVMPVTVGAEETVLWSDTFNGYDNIVAHKTSAKVGDVLADGTSGRQQYLGINGVELATVNKADDSSFFKVNGKESDENDKYLTTQIARFSSVSRGAYVQFLDTDKNAAAYSAETGKDIVLAFKIKMKDATDADCTYDTLIQVGNTEISRDALGIENDTWADVKIVASTTGTSVYVNGSSAASVTGSDKSISKITLDAYIGGVRTTDGNTQTKKANTEHPFGYPEISFDDMVVYSSDDGAASTVPPAETHLPAGVEYDAPPAGTIPEGQYEVAKNDFNSLNGSVRYIYSGDGQGTYTELDAVNLLAAADGDVRGTSNWTSTANAKADPAKGAELFLKANNGQGSTANRGPKLQFKYGDIEERENVTVQFAARLHKSDTAPAEVVFSGDLVASDSKGNLASPLALITTDANADSAVYSVSNSIEKNGANVIEVPDNEWVLVKIEASRSKDKTAVAKISVTTNAGKDNEETKYIFGDAENYADLKDNTKSGVNNLPYISFRSGNDSDYGVSNTQNDIDNVLITSSNDPKADVWYVYAAVYADGVLKSVTVDEVSDPSTVTPSADENTKTFIWNANMVPYKAAE